MNASKSLCERGRWPKLRYLFVFCFLALLQASACTPTIEVAVTYPGEVQGAARLKNVAVLPFTGRDGGYVAEVFSDVLKETAFLALADETAYRAYELKEISGPILENDAAFPEFAQSLYENEGVSGLYTGHVYDYVNRRFTEIEYRDVCRDFDVLNRCRRLSERRIYCERTHIRIHLQLKLYDIAQKRYIYDREHRERFHDRICEDEPGYSLGSRKSSQLLYNLLTAIRRQIAPYAIAVDLPYRGRASGLEGAAAVAFEAGVSAMKAGERGAACAHWRTHQDQAAASPALAFNLALCTEMDGDLPEAERQYRALAARYSTDDPPPKDLDDAIQRCIKRQQALRQLPL